MVHAGTVAGSPEELEAWIARTDDIRERLTAGGYGSEFTADDLYPLFQGSVARATAAAPSASRSGAGRSRWLWIGLIVIVVVAIVAGVIVVGRIPS